MKVLHRKDFLKLPAGVVYAKMDQHENLGAWEIKEASLISPGEDDGDFVVSYLDPDFAGTVRGEDAGLIMFQAKARGSNTPPVQFTNCGRDGLFDRDQWFAVLEREDHLALVAKLQDAFSRAYEPEAQA